MESKMLDFQEPALSIALLQRGEDSRLVELRDLRRYYTLLNYHLLETNWTESEAHLICEALKDYQFEDDPEQARTVWKQIHNAVHRDHLDQKWSINQEIFHRKVQDLNELEAIALVDAVERYWVRAKSEPQESLSARLMSIGLIKCCDFAL